MRVKYLFLSFLVSSPAFSQSTRQDIATIANQIQAEVYGSPASEGQLQAIRAQLSSALIAIRGSGGGTTSDVYCRRINATDYYAPARVSDQTWLEDNGTTLARCQEQVRSARYDLICSQIGSSDFYAPKLISNLAWRGANGTVFATCQRQVSQARPQIFCQHVRDTDYYAIAKITTGDWLQENGATLDQCLAALGKTKD